MQQSVQRRDTERYILLAVVAVLGVLAVIAIWQAVKGTDNVFRPEGTGSEITLGIDRDQADDIAKAHTRGTVADTQIIRDNGVISYLITLDPEADNGDASARRVLFIDPKSKSVTREERWNVETRKDVLVTKQEAEAEALSLAGVNASVDDTDLSNYEGKDVWQIKVDPDNAPSRLVTIDASTGDVIRSFELLRDY